MVVLTCFSCLGKVKPDEAVHTRDGRVACPECAKGLGIKVEQLQELRETVRMVERDVVEAEREKLTGIAGEGGEHSALAGAIVEALDWVLGTDRWPPSEKLT
jgi:hypothetical protein